MRIFTRYILKEVLSHGVIGTAVFTFVIFMRDVTRILELVVRNSAPIPSVAQLFFLTLPTAFTVTIPMGVLVGVLIGLSRMAADSEVTAMRASGVSVRTFLAIVSIFGISAWILATFNTTVMAPRSVAALADLEKTLVSSQLSFQVQPRVFYEDFKNLVLYVEDVTSASGAAVWKNVFLADISTPGAPKITIARQAIVSSGGPNTIRLHLVNGETHESSPRGPDEYNISTFTETDTAISLPPAPKPAQDLVPLSQQSTRDLLTQSRGPDKEKARFYWIEFNRRFALPGACLVLVMIGIPLGIASRKGGKGAGFVLALVLVFIYYFLYIAGLSMAKGGRLSPVVGVWMGNVVFALIGAVLLWRADKMPIELGLGQVLASRLKDWRQARARGREERVNGKRSRRVFSRRFPLLLDDYVLRNFTGYLFLMLSSLVVLFLIFTYFELLSDIVRKKIPLLTQLEYLINYTPSVLYLIMPLAV
ncbi:MAG TPA: LptF/LptG family permease, partial [Terriglobales bacterium]|nr:LptF/LptG family permease [Terriglobales bacterium]